MQRSAVGIATLSRKSASMLIRILGSSAGGGFPQWNCNGANSSAVRNRKPGFRPRTQSSLAVSGDGEKWVLLNASPDLRQQINDTPALWPKPDGGPRNSPIKAVVLTNGDVDHIIGLINLREAQPLSVYGSSRVLATLASNSVFQVLAPDKVPRIELPLGRRLPITGDGMDLGLTVEAFPVPGKVALYLEDASKPGFGSESGDTIGLEVTDNATGRSFFYIPGCARMDAALAKRLDGAQRGRGADDGDLGLVARRVDADGIGTSRIELVERGIEPRERASDQLCRGGGGRARHVAAAIGEFEKVEGAQSRRVGAHANDPVSLKDPTRLQSPHPTHGRFMCGSTKVQN